MTKRGVFVGGGAKRNGVALLRYDPAVVNRASFAMARLILKSSEIGRVLPPYFFNECGL